MNKTRSALSRASIGGGGGSTEGGREIQGNPGPEETFKIPTPSRSLSAAQRHSGFWDFPRMYAYTANSQAPIARYPSKNRPPPSAFSPSHFLSIYLLPVVFPAPLCLRTFVSNAPMTHACVAVYLSYFNDGAHVCALRSAATRSAPSHLLLLNSAPRGRCGPAF